MELDKVNIFDEPNALESFQSKLDAVPVRPPDVGSIEPIEETGAQKRVRGLASLLQGAGFAGGDPRRSYQMSQKLLRTVDPYQQGGIGEFLPGFSYELAQERGDKFGQLLSTIDMIPGAAVGTAVIKAGKAGKGVESITKAQALADEPKDMVFLHNTSPDKLVLYDNIGGLPSPSIAVTKADVPHEGFGNITLIGKPEKFDPAVDPRNKVYSADAYTPRGPKPIRLAKPGAAEQLAKDYAGIKTVDRDASETLEKGTYALRNLEKDSLHYPQNRTEELDDFFYSGLAKRKYAKEKGLPDSVFSQYDDFIDYEQFVEFNKWAKAEKDKYLGQDSVFQYFDEAEQTLKTVPYDLETVVANMIADTQRGGEAVMTGGDNYIRALTSKTYPDLPSIKSDKSRISSDFTSGDTLFDDIGEILETEKVIGPDDFYKIGEIMSFVKFRLESGEKLETAVNGAVKSFVNNYYNLKYIDEPSVNAKILKVFEDNANKAVNYFEAKPTRAVGFDEFSGALVPETTPQSTIDLLEKRGLKVIKEKEGSSKGDLIKENFGKELFSVAPIAAAAGVTAMMENEDKGLDSL
tara:strand:+ start:1538 stop:3268 length:1731 start_codon:yes stop_codon:yes gene_type:complete